MPAKIYETQAAWEAAEKSTTESTLALISSTNECETNGVNVETTNPGRGAAVYADADGAVHFIVKKTLNKDLLPNGYIPCGQVVRRKGNKVLIAGHLTSAVSRKWASVFQWRVTGWVLDNTDHACTVTLHGIADGVFTYNASTLEAAYSQLKTWIEAHEVASYHYSVHFVDGDIILQLDNYSAAPSTNTITSLTLTAIIGTGLPTITQVRRVNGYKSYFSGVNVARIKEYYKNNTSADTNPTSPLTSIYRVYPVSLTAYLGENCQILRDTYGEGEDGYDAFLVDNAIHLPDSFGAASFDYSGESGKAATELLAERTYTDTDGNTQYLHPAAKYCHDYGYTGVEGLEPGDWYLGSAAEVFDMMRDITMGLSGVTRANSDDVNETSGRMGGQSIPVNAGYWTSSRFSTGSAWYLGSSSVSVSGSFYSSFRVVPLTLYTLRSSD